MTKVLVLNSSYEPLNICEWRRALLLVNAGKATVLESEQCDCASSCKHSLHRRSGQDHNVASTCRSTVIVLKRYVKRPQPRLAPSRRNILHRDGYACRYCKAGGKGVTLTLDHVIPRCQGGKNSWENLVTACSVCNGRKGGRSLEESGMVLSPMPHYPLQVATFRASMFRRLGMSHPSWDKYLPPESPQVPFTEKKRIERKGHNHA
ncbi:MAG TPA: HNH endonuclease [Candidatus Obscuribacter sp.]|nr:HNH endonuclease [Candidatus Obscuribacter sp.]